MEILEFIYEQRGYLMSKMSRQDADDLIQDIAEKVWKLKNYFEGKPIEEQRKIAIKCLQNRRYDIIRISKQKKRSGDLIGVPTYTNPSVYSHLELSVVEKIIKSKKLTVLLDLASGYNTSELMEIYNIEHSTLRCKIHHNRKVLKKILNNAINHGC